MIGRADAWIASDKQKQDPAISLESLIASQLELQVLHISDRTICRLVAALLCLEIAAPLSDRRPRFANCANQLWLHLTTPSQAPCAPEAGWEGEPKGRCCKRALGRARAPRRTASVAVKSPVPCAPIKLRK